MRVFKPLLLLLSLSFLHAQAPVSLQVTEIHNITSLTQVIDNRSIQRKCNNSTFSVVSGTGSWSVQLEYADVANTGPWTSFGAGAIVTATAPLAHGAGYGFHNFFRLNTTVGTTVVTFSCEQDFALPSGGGGGSGANPGGNPGDFQVNVGGVSFGGLTPPIPVALGGTGLISPLVVCTSGIVCPGTWPDLAFSLTNPTPIYVGTPAQEVPGGAINGTNSAFTLVNSPNVGTLLLFRNGVRQQSGVDYTLSGSVITFLTGAIPQAGDTLVANYQYGLMATGYGTITGVVAGVGLSGGGVSGSVTLNAQYANYATNPDGVNCIYNVSPTFQYNGAIYVCGSGGTYAAYAGGGSGNATSVNGAAVPTSAVILSNSLGQLVNGIAAVQNVNNRAVLRDDQNALDNGNFSTNGIASSITVCGTSVACAVLAPPSYSTAEVFPCESVNWYYNTPGSPCSTAYNVQGFDQRYGDWRTYVNARGNNVSGTRNTINYNLQNNDPSLWYTTRSYENVIGMSIAQENSAGGINVSQTNYSNKTNFMALSVKEQSITQGQHNVFGVTDATGGMGDALAMSISSNSGGGRSAFSDEGTKAFDAHVGQFPGAYDGTITAVSGSTLTVNSTQMPDTQGEGRTLIRLNAATISSGTISFLSPSISVPEVVTFAGVTLPTESVQATIGTAVTTLVTSTTVVTPNTFTIGTIAGITTSTRVCVTDTYGGNWEMVQPTAVTGTTFTAIFRQPHTATAVIVVGGLCGYGLDITADDITTANSATSFPAVPPVGTVRSIWPVMSNTTTQLLMANGANPVSSQYQNISGKNGYVLYTIANVIGATDNGGTADSFTVGPSNASWTVADTVEETMGPTVENDMGIWEIHGYQATQALTAQASGIYFSTPMQGADTMWGLFNNWPDKAYATYNAAGAGNFLGPEAIVIGGAHKFALHILEPGDYGEIDVDCPASPQTCTKTIGFLRGGNSNSSYDYLAYNQGNESWQLFAGAGSSSVNTIVPHLGSAGTGYSPGDTFSINFSGGSGATGYVTQIGSSGSVTYAAVINHGAGYVTTTGLNTSGGAGSGLHVYVTSVSGGAITGITPNPNSPGGGYGIGNVVSIIEPPSATGATATVSSISGTGGVTGLTVSAGGSSYTVTPIPTTTTLTGSGSGLSVDITATEGQSIFLSPQWFSTNYIMENQNTLANTVGCTSESRGVLALISDSQTNSPGAVITGGGASKVEGFCYNNQWTVMGGEKASASVSVIGATGNLGTTLVCQNVSQCVIGNYTVSVPFVVTSTGTTGTVTVYATYGDGYALVTRQIASIVDPGTPGSVLTNPVSIHSDGSNGISISTSSTGSTVYSLYPTVTAQ